jgi:hypothetical protein
LLYDRLAKMTEMPNNDHIIISSRDTNNRTKIG